MVLNCYACKAEIVFDDEHIGKNGKKIPLDPFTKTPHDCPMREKKGHDYSKGSVGDNLIAGIKEDKDDHGNESSSPKLVMDMSSEGIKILQEASKYVDHTTQKPSKVKIFHAPNSDLVEIQYNEFNKEHTFAWARAHFAVSETKFAIALYYEESK